MATQPYFISESQFTGSITLDFGTSDFPDDLASEFEESILIDLLGYELFKAVVNDLDASNDAQTTKYIALVDGVAAGWTDSGSVLRRLKGIKTMLSYLFYDRYIEELQATQSTIGVFEQTAENAKVSNRSQVKKQVRAYNIGLVHYGELADFINYKNSQEGSDYYENYTNIEKDNVNTFGI